MEYGSSAAIYYQVVTVDEATLIAAEKKCGRSDVPCQARASHRRRLDQILLQLGHLAVVLFVGQGIGSGGATPKNGRGNGTGRYSVDADTERAQFHPGHLRVVGYGHFCGGIEVPPLPIAQCRYAGIIDD